MLVKAGADDTVEREVALPEAVDAKHAPHGFEGVAAMSVADGEHVIMAFQRTWEGEPGGRPRLGLYDPAAMPGPSPPTP